MPQINKKVTMQFLLLAMLLLSAQLLEAALDFGCSENFSCHCVRTVDKIHCTIDGTDAPAFDLTVYTSKSVRIKCVNSPDWSDFRLGESLQIGDVMDLRFVDCELPGPKYVENVVGQLEIGEVENLKVEKIRGNVSKANLDAFPELKGLFLSDNAFGRVPLDLLYGLPQLTQLDLRNTQIKLPVTGFFKNSRSLLSLDLGQNDLHDVQPGAFDGLGKLELLNLWSSNISTLRAGVFRGLSALVSLDLSGNHLSVINKHLFFGLDALQELNMEQNDLKFIENDALFPLRKLRVAKFANNQLNLRTDIVGFFGPLSPFHACTHLAELYLSHNNVSEIFADWNMLHFRLRKLDLSYNSLKYLQSENLQFVSDHVQADLTHNNILSVDLSRLELISGENKSSSRKVVIDLNFNPIHCDCELYSLLRYTHDEIQPQALDFLSLKLQHLTCQDPEYVRDKRLLGLKTPGLKCAHEDQEDSSDPCAKNGICECWLRPLQTLKSSVLKCSFEWTNSSDPCARDGVCQCWFRSSDRTLVFDCAARNLTKAPATINVGNASRVEVDLSGNLLRAAPSLTSRGYERVRLLNLSGNHIDSIDESLISPNLESLILDGNNLSFIEDSVLTKITDSSNLRVLTLHNNPWRCDLPFTRLLQLTRLLQSDHRKIRCALTSRILLYLRIFDFWLYSVHSIVIVCSSILLLLGGIAMTHIFLSRWQRKKRLAAEDELDKNKNWDVFICYAHEDEDFVVEKLEKELEHSARFHKFCINDTDVTTSVWVASKILSGIEESKRTVIVVSPNYIQSPWSRMTFEAVRVKSLEDKCPRAIIILYGDVKRAKVKDPHLRRYLKTNNFVGWDDPAFRQKLRRALPRTCELPKKVQSKKVEDLYITNRHDIVRVHIS